MSQVRKAVAEEVARHGEERGRGVAEEARRRGDEEEAEEGVEREGREGERVEAEEGEEVVGGEGGEEAEERCRRGALSGAGAGNGRGRRGLQSTPPQLPPLLVGAEAVDDGGDEWRR